MDPDFRALYGAAYPRLVRALTVACGDQGAAEDAVQEAFVQLVPRWGRVRDDADPEGWLRTVALRRSRGEARQITHLRPVHSLHPSPSLPGAPVATIRRCRS